jgi:hypothetical protein
LSAPHVTHHIRTKPARIPGESIRGHGLYFPGRVLTLNLACQGLVSADLGPGEYRSPPNFNRLSASKASFRQNWNNQFNPQSLSDDKGGQLRGYRYVFSQD